GCGVAVVYPYFTQVNFFILLLAVKTGVEIVNQQVFFVACFRFIEADNERRKQDKIGEHRNHEGGRSQNSKCNRPAEVGEGKDDKSGKQDNGRVDDTLPCFEDAIGNGAFHLEAVAQNFLTVLRQEPDRVVDRDTECNTKNQCG